MDGNHTDPDKPTENPEHQPLAPEPEALDADPRHIDRTQEVMTLRDAAEYLKCHPSTLYRMLTNGDIPGFRLGGSWRFRRSDLDKWIATLTAKPAESKPAPRKGRAKRRKG